MRNRRPSRRIAGGPAELENLELHSWWNSETVEFQTFVLRLLASLPGGEEAEEMGFEPFGRLFLGWQEMKMITEMLDKIESAFDVEHLVRILTTEEEYEE